MRCKYHRIFRYICKREHVHLNPLPLCEYLGLVRQQKQQVVPSLCGRSGNGGGSWYQHSIYVCLVYYHSESCHHPISCVVFQNVILGLLHQAFSRDRRSGSLYLPQACTLLCNSSNFVFQLFFFFKQESQMHIKTAWWSSFWYRQLGEFKVTFRFKPQADTSPRPH